LKIFKNVKFSLKFKSIKVSEMSEDGSQ